MSALALLLTEQHYKLCIRVKVSEMESSGCGAMGRREVGGKRDRNRGKSRGKGTGEREGVRIFLMQKIMTISLIW